MEKTPYYFLRGYEWRYFKVMMRQMAGIPTVQAVSALTVVRYGTSAVLFFHHSSQNNGKACRWGIKPEGYNSDDGEYTPAKSIELLEILLMISHSGF